MQCRKNRQFQELKMCSPYVCEKHGSIVIKIGKTLPRYATLVAIKPHMASKYFLWCWKTCLEQGHLPCQKILWSKHSHLEKVWLENVCQVTTVSDHHSYSISKRFTEKPWRHLSNVMTSLTVNSKYNNFLFKLESVFLSRFELMNEESNITVAHWYKFLLKFELRN